MGWLSDVLDALEVGGGVAADVATGGAAIPFTSGLVVNGAEGLVGAASGSNPAASNGNVLAGASGGALGAQQIQNQQNLGYNTNLVNEYNAELNQANLENTTAVQNPAKFAGQSVLASILEGNGRVGGSAVNPNASALGTLNSLQASDAMNEANSPTVNPVPSIGAVKAPSLQAPTGSVLANVLGAASLIPRVLGNTASSGSGVQPYSANPNTPTLNSTDLPPGSVQNPDGTWTLPPAQLSNFNNPGLGNQDLLDQ